MNLNNMSDEELDRLFKASADNFDPPFDPEAWAAMDQKLEQVQMRHSWFRRFYPFVGLVLLISIVAIFQLADRSATNVETTFTKSEQTPGIAKNKSVESGKINSAEAYKALNTERNAALDKPETASIEKLTGLKNKEQTTASKSIQESTSGLETANPNQKEREISHGLGMKPLGAIALKQRNKTIEKEGAEDARRSVRETRLSSSTNRNKVNSTEAGGETSRTAEEAKIVQEIEPEASLLELMEHRQLVLAPAFHAANPTLEFLPLDSTGFIPDSAHQQGQPRQIERNTSFLRYVQVTLAVAPDFTTVKFKDPEAVSANAGLLLGVPLTNRLSLVTGVVWANKVYSARAEDYHFSNGYTYTLPVDATCKVVDIPVNLQYKVLGNEKQALAIQAGLSSYLMLSEEYSSGGYYPYYKEVSNENQHWFKVQNVSLVYTRAISPVFSFGVEPFVKIPYGGIGDGKVKLTSAGVFFSAGYRIKLKP